MDDLMREQQRRAAFVVQEAWEELKRWKGIEDAVRGHRADEAIHAVVVLKELRFKAALDVLADVYEDSTSSSAKPEPPSGSP